MRWLPIFVGVCLPALAQSTLYLCGAVTVEYVVGAKLPVSGLFAKSAQLAWQHTGYNHPFLFGLDYDPRDPSTLYLAAGNGLIRASEHGSKWKILTGSDVTELRDVSVDRKSAGTVYFAHSAGMRVTHDGGVTWRELAGSLRRKYTEAIRVDRTRSGVVLAGTEQGILRSSDEGTSWKLAGAAGFQILHIEQSPHDGCFWLAATQGGGLFASRDCGLTFENLGRIGVGHNVYDIAFDPVRPERIALASWGTGVLVSGDGGTTWHARNQGLPRADVWSVIFDPGQLGRLYASVHEEALYVSENDGASWSKAALDGTIISRMKFIPQAASK